MRDEIKTGDRVRVWFYARARSRHHFAGTVIGTVVTVKGGPTRYRVKLDSPDPNTGDDDIYVGEHRVLKLSPLDLITEELFRE